MRIDLKGKPAGKITKAEAAAAEEESSEIFAEIEAHKRRTAAAPPAPAAVVAPAVRTLSVDPSLDSKKLLAGVKQQLGVIEGVMALPATAFTRELIRPALRLMVDELNLIVTRLDKEEV